MKRRMFGYPAALSLALFLIASVLLLASTREPVSLRYKRGARAVGVEARNGLLGIQFEEFYAPPADRYVADFPAPPPDGWGAGHSSNWNPWNSLAARGDHPFANLGFGVSKGGWILGCSDCPSDWAETVITSEKTYLAPWWFVLLVTAPLPYLWCRSLLVRRRQRRLSIAGRCVACGYDLRASPAHCPECGRPGKAPVAPASPASCSPAPSVG